MIPAASFQPQLRDQELREWALEQLNHARFPRRLVIWMTYHACLHAKTVADLLELALRSVWKWIGEYNRYGPAALERQGRGGRSTACR